MDIKDYKQYYAFQGYPIKDDATLKQMLMTALKNSAEKGYHGKEGDLNAIPSLPDQVEDVQRTYPTILKYWNDKENSLDKKDD